MQNLSQMLLAICLASIGAILFIYLNLPLPWLLGSIFITSLLIRFEKLPIKKPNHYFSTPVRIIVGVTIGSAFTPAILEQAQSYIYSMLFVIPYVLLTAFCGIIYYWKFQGFDKKTAYMAAMPGGIIEMVLLGEELKANVAKITLVQASRLFFLVLTLPFIIQYIFQIDISGNRLITPSFSSLAFSDVIILIIIGITGAVFGKKINMPAAYLIGPMIVSVLAFSMGLIESKPPDELLKFVQVVIGASIGFTFRGVKVKQIIKTLVGTLGHFIILAIITGLFVVLVHYTLGFPALSIVLAFMPGGQTESNLIAILVAANVPYITLHHIVRLIIVFNLAPIFARMYLKD